jgi:peptidoglycan hydrolase-like protein with peptidoglycan-binding domain
MKYHFDRGAPDATVLEAQQLLHENGVYVGPLDGVISPAVKWAIWRFQQTRGLARSGSLDRLTLAELGVGGTAMPYASPPSFGFGARGPALIDIQEPLPSRAPDGAGRRAGQPS